MLFNKRDLINLIVPLFVEQLLATTIGMADTMMVSNVSENAVSAVGLVDSLNVLLISIFAAISTGASVVISQYVGSHDIRSGNLAAVQSVLAGIAISVLIMFVCIFSGDYILMALFEESGQAILNNASVYFFISALSYPFLAVQSSCAAIFRSVRNSKMTMYVSVIMNLINITGNAILIFGFNLGVAGAAMATLFSRVFGAVLMVYLLLDKRRIITLKGFFPIKLRFDILQRIFMVGIPAGTETVIFQVGKVLTQKYIAGFGSEQISANTICSSLFSLTNMPGNTLNLAIVTIVGQCVGAKKYKEAKSYTLKLCILGAMMLATTNFILYLGSDTVLSLYKAVPEAVTTAKTIILYATVAQALFWTPAFVIPNALRASGDAKYTMMVSICTMWIFRVGFGYVLAIYWQMGAVGVWISMFIDWVFRSAFFVTRFLRNKWMNKRII